MTRKQIAMGLAGVALLGGLVHELRSVHSDAMLVLHTVPMAPGANLFPLAVDTRTGRAFVTDRSTNRVSVLDTARGRLVRLVQATGQATSYASSLVVDAQTARVFVAGDASRMTVLDAGSGALLRRQTVGSAGALPRVPIALAVAQRCGRVFVGYFTQGGSNGVSMLDARSGALLQTIPVRVTPQVVAVDERTSRAFVLSNSDAGPGAVTVLDACSGHLLRTLVLDPLLGTPGVDERSGHVFVLAAGPRGPRLCMLDGQTGRLVRAVTVPVGTDGAGIAVAAAVGRVLVGGNDGRVSVVDANNGLLLHALTLGRSVSAPVVADAGRAFVVNYQQGSVSVIDTRRGALVKTVTVGPNPGALTVDAPTRRVYVPVAGPMDQQQSPKDVGQVAVLDARTGSVLHVIPVGVGPFAIAVDDRAQRALVLNAGGSVQMRDPWDWLPSGLRERLPFIPQPPPPQTGGSVSVLDASR